MSPAEMVAALPDDAPVYVPGVGEVTLGAIRGVREREGDLDSRARTIAMWGYIATHPDAKPWLSGRTHAGSAESTA